MATEYVLQTPPQIHDQPVVTSPKNSFRLPLFIGGGIILIITAVILGFILGKGSTKPNTAMNIPTSTPSPSVKTPPNPSTTPTLDTPNIAMLPDKQYFDDTYVVIQKNSPHSTLILSVSRIEQKQNFTQYTHLNYFNGKTWDRKNVLSTNQSSSISTNPLLRSWNDPAEVLRVPEKELVSISLPSQTISFSSTALQNEISLQSIPGSTKFMYQGNGSITLDGQPEQAYVYYSRTYSFNASDLSYLLRPNQLKSDWMVFWDTDGTFYHLDSHSPQNPTSAAQVLTIGVRVENDGVTTKTKDASSTIDLATTSKQYQENFGQTINDTVLLPFINTFDKSDKKSYTWYLTAGEGSAVKREGRTVKGVGLIEHIVGLNFK